MTESQPDEWDRVAEGLAAERRRRVERRADWRRGARAEFGAARDAGLRIRHATKLARLAAAGPRPGPCGCTESSWCAQHWQVLAPSDRAAWRRSHPRTTKDTP